MKKKTAITLGIVGGAVVIGAAAVIFGPKIYANYFVPEAALAPAEVLASETAAASELNESDVAGTWTITEGSTAGYRVDEILGGEDITVTGQTTGVSGTVETSETEVTSAEIVVDVASITTDDSNRDDYFRNDALQTETYPEATFVLIEPIALQDEPGSGESATASATGELTMHGVTQQVTAELTVVIDGETVRIGGSIPVTFEDYGVTAPNLGFVSVEPDGFVEFVIDLTK